MSTMILLSLSITRLETKSMHTDSLAGCFTPVFAMQPIEAAIAQASEASSTPAAAPAKSAGPTITSQAWFNSQLSY